MYSIFLLLHVVLSIGIVALVLLQQGRGSEAGAAFGSGASATVFGSRGSASFLSRVTAGLATGFFLTSMTLAYFATQTTAPTSSVVDGAVSTPAVQVETPAVETPVVEENQSDVPTVPDSN